MQPPQNLHDFIGQANIRRMLRVASAASLQRNRPVGHILLTGPSGLGKSTLARIVASLQNGKFIECLAGKLSEGRDWKELFHEVEGAGYKKMDAEKAREIILDQGVEALVADTVPISKSVVFLDEIHRLTQKQQEMLFTVMTKNILYYTEKDAITKAKVTRWLPVPLFTLVGATTEEGTLSEPFLNRFSLRFKLEPYTVEELKVIVQNAVKQTACQATDDAIAEIACRSRGIARVALNFLMTCSNYALLRDSKKGSTIIDKSITDIAFSDGHLSIDDKGLAIDDLRYLFALHVAQHPIGLNTLISILHQDQPNIVNVIEPHLIRQGLIMITPSGRVIKRGGIEHIRSHPFLHRLSVAKDALAMAICKDEVFEEAR